jgi:hypothetical protein
MHCVSTVLKKLLCNLFTNKMLKNIRVLHIISALNRGGIETWLMYLLRLQRPKIHLALPFFRSLIQFISLFESHEEHIRNVHR